MRIGILPVLNGLGGGVYQYSLAMLRALEHWQRGKANRSCILFTNERDCPALDECREHGWETASLRPPASLLQRMQKRAARAFGRVAGATLRGEIRRWTQDGRQQWNVTDPGARSSGTSGDDVAIDPDVIRYRPRLERWFARHGVDLMLYPYPEALSFEAGTPYVVSVHDLQHRLQPEFPEVSADGEWERREYLFRNAIRGATMILVDSEVGKEDVLNCYGELGITAARIAVLPFVPSSYLAEHIADDERQRVRAAYDLPERYLFYPAQFWPHKNHLRIIEALGVLQEREGLHVPLVLCGSHKGAIREAAFAEVQSRIDSLNLRRQVHCLGYVPDGDMSALYAGAEALVMPTFFGPTNIPVVEAWKLGCPVLTSDIRGIREQAGDAALLADPRSTDSIADGIRRLWTDSQLRESLVRRGRRRLADYTPDDFRRRLEAVLDEVETCRFPKHSRRQKTAKPHRSAPSRWWRISPGTASRLPT